jgi:hypothetical protein
MKTIKITFENNSRNTKTPKTLNEVQLEAYRNATKKINKYAVMYCINEKVYGIKIPKDCIENRLSYYGKQLVLMLPINKAQMLELIENGSATYYCTKNELEAKKQELNLNNNGQAIEYIIKEKDKVKIDHTRRLAEGGDGYRYEIKYYEYGSTKHDRIMVV